VAAKTGRNSAPVGNWYHVVGVYDDKDVRIYLNGELRGRRTFDLDTGSTTPDKNLMIGARSYESTIKSFFGGKIDEVRIYDGALSDAEIWSLYENGSLQ
jgi:MSHA biogenesis protein MshQ